MKYTIYYKINQRLFSYYTTYVRKNKILTSIRIYMLTKESKKLNCMLSENFSLNLTIAKMSYLLN